MLRKNFFNLGLRITLIIFMLGLFFIGKNVHFLEAQVVSPDAIAIRVLPNPKHYSAVRWYKQQNFSGSPQVLAVGGYEAVRDGRSVYVNVANVSSTNTLFTNIYLISFNQDAENETIDIFSQILSHWKFNTNKPIFGTCREDSSISCLTDDNCPIGDYCSSAKARIIRDTRRLADLEEIKITLEEYNTSYDKYPALTAGTYIPNRSLSVWPSWNEELSQALGGYIPVDPVNRLGDCSPASGYADGYDADSCWNDEIHEFAEDLPDLPDNSLIYSYVSNSAGSTYGLCTVFESGLTISGGSTVGTCAEICIDFDGDGYGSPGSATCAAGSILTDCDDNDPAVNPTTTTGVEDCTNGSDDDCNGFIDCLDPACALDPFCSCPVGCNCNGICEAGETCTICGGADNCCTCPDGFCDVFAGECNTCYGPGNDCGCGDNILCISAGEECDDGNNTDGDGCSASCAIEVSTCADNDGDGYDGIQAGCTTGTDCNDLPGSCGINGCFPGNAEVCDGYDNNCSDPNHNPTVNASDIDEGFSEEDCSFVCLSLNSTYNYSSGRTGDFRCCGDDNNGTTIFEGNPYQVTENTPIDLCNDGQDNDCDGDVDWDDSDCSGACTNLGENNFVNSATPGVCNQCSNIVGTLPSNIIDNDIDQTGNWGVYEYMIDVCDPDCGIVTTSFATQIDDYEDGTEISCDGIDNDCDGEVDEGVTTRYYYDGDDDEYGWAGNYQDVCVSPGSDWVLNSADCDDTDPTINPLGSEVCDTVDNDCDGEIDEGVTSVYYEDSDSDTYGNSAVTTSVCIGFEPSGYVLDGNDCDDTDPNINPGATEICDGIDNDCDGDVDEVCATCYPDGDNDGYGDEAGASSMMATCAIANWSSTNDDCDDIDALVNPGATEICDGIDNNCDGNIDDTCATCYPDGDDDGYGAEGSAPTTMATCAIANWSDNNTDCDDGLNWINPGAAETCDTNDNDCDGSIDEGCDDDGDGYCDFAMAMYNSNVMCLNTTIYTFPADNGSPGNDCNDGDASFYPGAPEICGDLLDQDCNLSDLSCAGVCDDDDGDRQIVQGTDIALCGPVCGIGNEICLGNNDCDDTDQNNYWGNTEDCNDGADNDCDAQVDCDDTDCPPCPNQCIFNPFFEFNCEFTL